MIIIIMCDQYKFKIITNIFSSLRFIGATKNKEDSECEFHILAFIK